MATSNQELSTKLVTAGAKPTTLSLGAKCQELYTRQESNIKALMGSEGEARRMYLTVMNTVSRSPQLLECSPASIIKCMVQCAELKLYPGPMQQAAIVPFWNSKASCLEAQFMPMYQGLVALAYRSGFIRRIDCEVVRTADEFDYVQGLNPDLRFRKSSAAERGDRVAVYAVIEGLNGNAAMQVMYPHEVESVRRRSKAATSEKLAKYSPWNSEEDLDVDWMWRKTALKQCLKMVPRSVEMAQAMEQDEEIERPDRARPIIVSLDSTPEVLGAPKKELEQGA